MDKNIIKNQISYWETVQKDMESQRKVLDGQIGTVKQTIKALRVLLPKSEKPEVDATDEFVQGTNE